MNIDDIDIAQVGVEFATEAGLRIIAAVLIFVIGRWVANRITRFVEKMMERAEFDPTLSRFLANILSAVLLVVVIIAAIGQLGVQTTSLLAVLGAAGLAVGLALQGSLSNFAAGVLIVAFRPYRVGDFIEAGGVAGTVEAVQIFTTVLKSPDNKRIVVPNSQITGGTIVNFSAHDTRRVDLVASCSYGDDLDKVRKVLEELLASDERILQEPAPVIAVAALNDSSVDFHVRPWVKSSDYWPVHFSLTEQIKKRFDAAGISIPFPQRDVHVYQHSKTD
ncbi:MAG: mechanosensitive ion channel [Chromatiales bacterium]|nr:mechanosensitive ion channel [Chromatiales bacterium]